MQPILITPFLPSTDEPGSPIRKMALLVTCSFAAASGILAKVTLGQIKTILLDVGGVFTPDPWEALWLTETDGLADSLGIDPYLVREAATQLFNDSATGHRTEDQYWEECSRLLGIQVPRQLVFDIETRLVSLNPHLLPFLRECAGKGITLGIISNNTAFWFPKQLNAEIVQLLNPDAIFLSHEKGVTKRPGKVSLFSLAAAQFEPSHTLVIDDRQSNIEIAREWGFHTMLYNCGGLINDRGYYQSPVFEPIRFAPD